MLKVIEELLLLKNEDYIINIILDKNNHSQTVIGELYLKHIQVLRQGGGGLRLSFCVNSEVFFL